MLAKWKGWRTIIFARVLMAIGVVAGLVIPVLDAVNATNIGVLIPAKYQQYTPFILVLVGVISEWLRRTTSGPVFSDLEVKEVQGGAMVTKADVPVSMVPHEEIAAAAQVAAIKDGDDV